MPSHGHGRAVILIELRGDVVVACAELHKHLVQQAVNLPSAEAADALDDAADSWPPRPDRKSG